MPAIITYPDGSVSTSTAQSDKQVQTAFQAAAAIMMGLLTTNIVEDVILTSGSNIATLPNLVGLYEGLQITAVGLATPTIIDGFGAAPNTVVLSNTASGGGTVSATIFDPNVWYTVRTGWLKEGEPSPPIDDDTCTVMATIKDTDFSRMHDSVYLPAVGNVITQQDVYTRTWEIQFLFYGPNCLDNSRAVKTGLLKVPYIDLLLAQNNLYTNPSIKDPQRIPENRQGQWWDRSDLVVEVNEQVTETYTVGVVQSVEIKVYNSSGVILDTTVIP
jgi:hypothetical protein